MLKKLFPFFALCLFAFGLQAQIQVGVKGGLNLANYRYEADGFESDPLTTFHVGPMVEFGITESFAVNAAALLTGRGAKQDLTLLGTTISLTQSALYVQVPLTLMYTGNAFYAGAGPYIGFGVGGKNKGDGSDVALKFGNGKTDDLSASDFGANFEAGFKRNNYRIGLGYSLGFADVRPSDVRIDGFSTKNSAVLVSLGYFF